MIKNSFFENDLPATPPISIDRVASRALEITGLSPQDKSTDSHHDFVSYTSGNEQSSRSVSVSRKPDGYELWFIRKKDAIQQVGSVNLDNNGNITSMTVPQKQKGRVRHLYPLTGRTFFTQNGKQETPVVIQQRVVKEHKLHPNSPLSDSTMREVFYQLVSEGNPSALREVLEDPTEISDGLQAELKDIQSAIDSAIATEIRTALAELQNVFK